MIFRSECDKGQKGIFHRRGCDCIHKRPGLILVARQDPSQVNNARVGPAKKALDHLYKPNLKPDEVRALCRPLWDSLGNELAFEAVDP